MNPFLGQIMPVAFNFAPRGWALCNGQALSIAQNTALFSLLGTTYGGDGVQSFNLPNLQSRVPIHAGQGGGLSNYQLGQTGGQETVTLTTQQMPLHNHGAVAANQAGTTVNPAGAYIAQVSGGDDSTPSFIPSASAPATLNNATIGTAGNNQPHNNIQPYLAIYFIIALEGIFPSRQ